MVAVSGNQSTLRVINDRAALDVLVHEETISRADLEQRVNLSKPATAALLARLEEAGLVEKAGHREVGPGPRAQLWSLRADAGFAAGVDVTRDHVDVAVADLRGRVVATVERVTAAAMGGAAAASGTAGAPGTAGTSDTSDTTGASGASVADVLAALEDATAQIGRSVGDLVHVAIGTPGALDPDSGRLRYAGDLVGWQDLDVRAALAEHLPVPCTVENDVNLVALNEMAHGAAQGAGSFFLLWLAERGIGSSVVVDGELIRGATLGAGEIGFTLVPDLAEAETPPVGRRYGDLLAAPALVALAAAHGIHAEGPVAALRRGLDDDPTGFPTDLARRVASGLAAVVSILDPELVVLDGEVSTAGGEPFRQLVSDALGTLVGPRVPIVTADPETTSVRAGALQAALTRAREHLFRAGSVIDPG